MGRGNLRQQAYRYLHDRIVTGALPAGRQVSEESIAKEIGISRTPVREAIGELEREGLVTQVPRYGTIIRAPDRQDLVELFELREALEAFAVARAAERISTLDLRTLERRVDEIRNETRTLRRSGRRALDPAALRKVLESDMGFHMTLLRAAGNRRILRSVSESRVLMRIFATRRQDHTLDVLRETDRFHTRILRAVRRRDGETARRLMAQHIRASHREALEHFDRMRAEAVDRIA